MSKCEICGEPMPRGEEMFNFHGYSGPCPKPPMLQPHQQRVVDEKAELDAKLTKLIAFQSTETFESLDEAERDRMRRQSDAMIDYSNVLAERIAAFRHSAPTGEAK